MHMLNLMENFDLVETGHTGVNVHRAVEAMKCASFLFNSTLVIADADLQLDLLHGKDTPTKSDFMIASSSSHL